MNKFEKIIIFVEGLEMQMFISTVLQEADFNTIIAENISDAFEKIIIENPLVAIIDMMMPKQHGIKIYRQLKTHDKFKTLPVIMLSTLDKGAFFKLENIEYTLPHHGLPKPEGYLTKPPEAEELIYTITKIYKNNLKRENKCL